MGYKPMTCSTFIELLRAFRFRGIQPVTCEPGDRVTITIDGLLGRYRKLSEAEATYIDYYVKPICMVLTIRRVVLGATLWEVRI